ncbi:hypothetical protein N8480_03350 [Flavobacteriaceae bacterium]|nr:hypothetical protein [Flavobacteriaceae bacterium]
MFKFIKLFLFFAPFFVSSQTIKGKIYGPISSAKNVSVSNISKGIKKYSNEIGDFKIHAKFNDTLVFESLLYEKKQIIIKKHHFEDVCIVDLKKVVNKLDQITLSTVKNNKTFNEKKATSKLKKHINNDIKLNSYKYSNPNPNMDIVAIFGLISKLLKKRKVNAPKKQIKHYQFDSLFNKDVNFNNDFLTKNLNIHTDHIQLFFSYCEVLEIDYELLNPSKRLDLMDLMFKLSKDYLKFINE